MTEGPAVLAGGCGWSMLPFRPTRLEAVLDAGGF
jgi:hypothetical protein